MVTINVLWWKQRWRDEAGVRIFRNSHNHSVRVNKNISKSFVWHKWQCCCSAAFSGCTKSKLEHAAVIVTEWHRSIKSLLWADVLYFNISLIVAAVLSAEAAQAVRGVAALRWQKVLSYFSQLSLCLLDPHRKKSSCNEKSPAFPFDRCFTATSTTSVKLRFMVLCKHLNESERENIFKITKQWSLLDVKNRYSLFQVEIIVWGSLIPDRCRTHYSGPCM